MKCTYIDLEQPGLNMEPVVACIGYFDGMHRGHQALLKKTCTLARRYGCQAGLITFAPDPWVTIYGLKEEELEHITMPAERLEIAQACGIKQVIILRFSKAMSQLSPSAFVREVLAKIPLKGLVCGFDFHYGTLGKGNVDTLAKDVSYPVTVVDEVRDRGQKISSSRIVALIKEGKVAAAAKLMKRPFAICGKVIHGAHNGTALGVPTANIAISPAYVKPLEGVYAGYAIVRGVSYPAMINYGHNPTVQYRKSGSLEANIIGFDGDLYGEEITVQFIRFLRHEKRFSSLEALQKQLFRDQQTVLRIVGKK